MKSIIVAAIVVLTAGCLAVIPAADTLADEGWDEYRRRFVAADGRVVDTGNRGISHSEGQGWGMILAQVHDDRATFDRIWNWTRANLGREDDGLHSWRYDPQARPAVSDPNNASDGDLFIAWALHLGFLRWNDPAYAADSLFIRRNIENELIHAFGGYQVLLPGIEGFEGDNYVDLNLSYWFMPALRDFASMEPERGWQTLIEDGRRLLGKASFGDYQLPTDWMRLSADGSVQPAPRWSPNFGFDAVRIPLYLVWGGFAGDKAVMDIASFWNAPNGRLPNAAAWIDVTNGEQADFPVSRGVLAIKALIDGQPWRIPRVPDPADDYYSASLLMLTRAAVDSGGGR